jgi:CheY-like chemotaxis protein
VAQTLQTLETQLPPHIRLQLDLTAPEGAITGDPALVDEALTNLCTNAIQAMPEEGVLWVRLEARTLTSALPLFETTLPPGDYLCLAVQDNGVGIASDVVPRLFDPFFTTRRQQKGTGLGLTVVHGVVVELGGGIDVLSQPGQGACFTLFFPRAQAGLSPSEATPEAHPPPWLGQGQVILVVDDEPQLVALAEDMLAGLGYEPFGLDDSRKALDCLRQEPHRFDLLLTDELMPHLSGADLAAEVRAFPSALPIVLVSGYGGPDLEQRAAAVGVTQILKKPYNRQALAQAVAQALQKPTETPPEHCS